MRLRHGMELPMEAVLPLLVMQTILSLLERVVRIRKLSLVEDRSLRMHLQRQQHHILKHGMERTGEQVILGLDELEPVDGDVIVDTIGMEALVQ